MSSRNFYWVVAISLCLFFAYPLLRMLLAGVLDLPIILLTRFKNILAIAIVIHETNRARRIIAGMNYALLLTGMAGLLMWTMRWPAGELTFIASGIGVLCLLVFNAAAGKAPRADRIMALVYPLFRFIATMVSIYRADLNLWIADLVVSAGLGGYLLLRLLRAEQREDSGVLDDGNTGHGTGRR